MLLPLCFHRFQSEYGNCCSRIVTYVIKDEHDAGIIHFHGKYTLTSRDSLEYLYRGIYAGSSKKTLTFKDIKDMSTHHSVGQSHIQRIGTRLGTCVWFYLSLDKYEIQV